MRFKRSSVGIALALAVTGCGSSRHAVTQETKAAKTRTGIVLDHRIGAVSFAEPEPRITKALGKGVVASLDGHRLRYYPTAGIYVDYPPNHPPGRPTAAVIIVTRSARYRTRSGVGVGVGSSLRQLRRRVKVRCYPT